MNFKVDTPARNFRTISVDNFVEMYKNNNPETDTENLKKSLKHFRALKLEGQKCDCGNPIWAIGSAFSGQGCFTCITGDKDNSNDYEIE
ncbi:MAG: hypothetical protein WEB89_08040 [Balneolales bacterium]